MNRFQYKGVLVAAVTIVATVAAPARAKDNSIYSVSPGPVVGEDGTLLTPTWSGITRETIANVGLRGSGPDVAIVASASGDITDLWFTDPRDKLLATGQFSSVTVIHAGLETPSLIDMQQYDAILVWSNFDFADALALGNNLADYVDGGGGVVVAVFANTSNVESRFLSGRWETEEYGVIRPQMVNTAGLATLGTVLDPGHATMTGVGGFSGGLLSSRPDTMDLTTNGNSVLIAEWSSGQPLVAMRDDLAGGRVDLGFYPPSNDVISFFWDASTDGDLLLANALTYAAASPDIDVELQLVPMATSSGVDVSNDPLALPGVLTADDCYDSFVLDLWASDVGNENTGILGFYVDLTFDNLVLDAQAIVHSTAFPTFQEGVIDNPTGKVSNFGGFNFAPNGVEPVWIKIGHVRFSVLSDQATTINSALGLAGIAVSGRPAPPLEEIIFGDAALVPFAYGDLDSDCDLDLKDFAGFQACFDQGVVGLCSLADFDGDNDVDIDDYTAFAASFTGPT